MSTTHRIPQLAIALALVALLTAAAVPARADQAQPAVTVRVSKYNARWPREPASGPLPPVVVPTATPAEPRNHTFVPVLGGVLLLVVVTGAATGVRLRPRAGQRVAA